MRLLRSVPRDAVEIFVWTRAGIWLAAIFVVTLFDPVSGAFRTPLDPRWDIDVGWGFGLWSRWDSGWFLTIAQEGYVDPERTTAFMPLYPLLVKVGGTILSGHYIVAGIGVSLACCAVAFVLLYLLAEPMLGEAGAFRSVLYLALFPMALFLGAVYSESLYLMLSIASFLLAVRGRFLYAGIAIGLAILTRSAGIALLPAVGLIAWRAEDRLGALLRLGVAPLIAAAWPAWLWWRFDDPLLFVDAQRSWARETSPWGPLSGLWQGLDAAWAGVRQLIEGAGGAVYWPHATDTGPMHVAAQNLQQFLFFALFVGLGVYAWRRFGAPYGVLVFASLALPLSAPTEDWPLLSMPRFGLGMFPIFLALGALGERPRAHVAIIAISSFMLALALVQWCVWAWVS
jgi:Mannosyltransferase (PIG-V)